MQERGKAGAGDKTMVDVLLPATEKASEMRGYNLQEALNAISRAAFQGMENTKEMIAQVGKAKTLGERALGHPDPGAVSTYLIIKYMAEAVDDTTLNQKV